eukprot:UN24364
MIQIHQHKKYKSFLRSFKKIQVQSDNEAEGISDP